MTSPDAGSTRVRRKSGDPVNRHFFERAPSAVNRFTGSIHDAEDYRARYYSPELGLVRGFDSLDQILFLTSPADRPDRL